jgi:uncharacterized iron-regulated membrane protein
MVSIDSTGAPVQAAAPASTNKLYLAAWRWHFYAGLYVIPFFAVLAITGMAMAWIAYIDGRDGERIAVQPQAVAQAVSAQARCGRCRGHSGRYAQAICRPACR